MHIDRFCLVDGLLLRLESAVREPGTETLLLATHAMARLPARALVVGTGAGLIPLLLARAGARVTASDLWQPACALTETNAQVNHLAAAIDVRHGDLFGPVAGEQFDLIVTNPPQMPTPPDAIGPEGHSLANNGGADGLAVVRRIVAECGTYLSPRGRLVMLLLAFLDVDVVRAACGVAGLTLDVVARSAKPYGALSSERRRYFDPDGLATSYDVLVVEIRAVP